MDLIHPSSTLAITAKANELKAQGKPVVSLAAGEPDFATPEPIRKAMIQALEQGHTRYTATSGTPEIKAAVAQKFLRDQGLSVDPSQVTVSCGAKHSLYNLIQALVGPGDDVLIPNPFWVSYPEMVNLAGANPVLVETSGNGYHMTADLIEKALTPRTRLVIINSPSNPTGAVLSRQELDAIAKLLVRKNLYAISDEIYEYYVYDGREHVSVAQLIGQGWENHVAIVNGVSKSYAMTGLRIGYSATHVKLARAMGMLQDHSTSNPVTLSQKGAVTALAFGADYVRDLNAQFAAKRDRILGHARQIPGLDPFTPEGAFYLFMSVRKTGLAPAKFCQRLLEERFVAAIPGEGFGSADGVRLSFAASVADIDEGMKRIREFVSTI
jgi:aspartate aminotransferase